MTRSGDDPAGGSRPDTAAPLPTGHDGAHDEARDRALQDDPSPEDLDALADERDRLAEDRDRAADRRGEGAEAARDRRRARDDREHSAADRRRAAGDRESAADDAQHMRLALAHRGVIGQAQGVLMQQLKVPADRAFELLVEASQHRNVKLRELAARVASEGWPLRP